VGDNDFHAGKRLGQMLLEVGSEAVEPARENPLI
jgi:hypothetical protein